MEQLELFLFGTPQLERNRTSLHLGRKKALGVLAYLATADHAQTRDHLATFFWPDHDPSQAYAELRRMLHVLRQALGDTLETNRETICISADSFPRVDVREFQSRIADWRGHHHLQDHSCEHCFISLAEAVEIYRDHFLVGFSLADSRAFDEWQTVQGQILRDQLAGALEWLVHYHTAHGSAENAIALAKKWVNLDPLHEPAHVLLTRLYVWSGQRAAAVRQSKECERVLKTELGILPQEETIQSFQSILDQHEPNPFEKHVPYTASTSNELPKHNLPFQAIPFVGREKLLDEIDNYLENPTCRLLTLAGPGGCGKSRLAIEVAKRNLGNFSDGAYFIPLAACESAQEIIPAMAKVLGFEFYISTEGSIQSERYQKVSAKQQLLGYLGNKSILLILDNFEHLLDGIELVVEMLESAPNVRILVTSRARLNILHEYVYPVPGLDLPNRSTSLAAIGNTEDLSKYSAVRFFEQCARMTMPQFKLSKENLASVLHICWAMQGMPLGILLSTTWLETLGLQEICVEIDRDFSFLETNLYGLPERQRSMRAIFNHTWKLLNDREQGILLGLSIFRGGFTWQAAQYVTGASLSDLKALVSKWLVDRDPGGRYNLHELLKQYLEEKLAEEPVSQIELKDRHLTYFADILYARLEQLEANDPKQAVTEISSDIENIQSAWNWALKRENIEAIERSFEGLAKFYEIHAMFQDGERAFSKASEMLLGIQGNDRFENKTRLLLGRILGWQGRFYGMQGYANQARELLQKSLDLLQIFGDRKELAYVLHFLSSWQLSTEESIKLEEKALNIFTDLNERRGIAFSLSGLGYTAFSQGNFYKARQLFQECLAIHKQLGNQRDIAYSLNDIGYINWITGDYGESLKYHQESLEILKQLDDKPGIAGTYNLLGINYASLKEYAKSKELIRERLNTSKEIGDMIGIAVSLTNIAECELMEGNEDEAYRLVQESYPYYKKIDEQLKNADWYFRILGEAECGSGDLKAGKLHLRQALYLQITGNVVAQATHTLIGIARYLAQDGQSEQALELLGLARNHPGSWQWVKDRVEVIIAKYKQELPLEVVNSALERGGTLDLEETVKALLTELEDEPG